MTGKMNAMNRFRKKYALTLLIFAVGSALAFVSKASLGEYTAFSVMLLGVFGASDLVDKKVPNK